MVVCVFMMWMVFSVQKGVKVLCVFHNKMDGIFSSKGVKSCVFHNVDADGISSIHCVVCIHDVDGISKRDVTQNDYFLNDYSLCLSIEGNDVNTIPLIRNPVVVITTTLALALVTLTSHTT